MRPFRSLIIAIALAVGSLGLYRWVQPPAANLGSSASGLTAPPAGPAVASAFGRSMAVSAHVAAKRLRVRPLDAGQRPLTGLLVAHHPHLRIHPHSCFSRRSERNPPLLRTRVQQQAQLAQQERLVPNPQAGLGTPHAASLSTRQDGTA